MVIIGQPGVHSPLRSLSCCPIAPDRYAKRVASRRRGSLSAGARRIAYDSLSQFQALQSAQLEPLTPDAWVQAARYSKTISEVLSADGVRCGQLPPRRCCSRKCHDCCNTSAAASCMQQDLNHPLASCTALRRGAEASGEELATLQEKALWELLSLFFLEGPGGSSSGPGLVAQVRGGRRRWRAWQVDGMSTAAWW